MGDRERNRVGCEQQEQPQEQQEEVACVKEEQQQVKGRTGQQRQQQVGLVNGKLQQVDEGEDQGVVGPVVVLDSLESKGGVLSNKSAAAMLRSKMQGLQGQEVKEDHHEQGMQLQHEQQQQEKDKQQQQEGKEQQEEDERAQLQEEGKHQQQQQWQQEVKQLMPNNEVQQAGSSHHRDLPCNLVGNGEAVNNQNKATAAKLRSLLLQGKGMPGLLQQGQLSEAVNFGEPAGVAAAAVVSAKGSIEDGAARALHAAVAAAAAYAPVGADAAAGDHAAAAPAPDDDAGADATAHITLQLQQQHWAQQTGVVFLGTGSAEPSKYRGPSGILLRVWQPGPPLSPTANCGETSAKGKDESVRLLSVGASGQTPCALNAGFANPQSLEASGCRDLGSQSGWYSGQTYPQGVAVNGQMFLDQPPVGPSVSSKQSHLGCSGSVHTFVDQPPLYQNASFDRPSVGQSNTEQSVRGMGRNRNTGGVVRWMMLDCGEGVWGQMQRMFGQEKAQEVVGRGEHQGLRGD
jgi:hypothetical protein